MLNRILAFFALFGSFQIDHGGAPATPRTGLVTVVRHRRMLLEYAPHDLPKGAGPLAVNDPYPVYPLLQAGVYIVRHQLPDIPRLKRMQIQRAVYGEFNWVVAFISHTELKKLHRRGIL